MNANRKKVLQGIEKIAKIRVEREVNRWPPLCRGALHQPKRPKKRV